jgi:anti-sigma factor RsiW
MTRCLDEAMLQSYFDGELSLHEMESATLHLASCETCAAAARELEEETALVMSALAAEFEASVPTEHLRKRIEEAVLGERIAVAQSTQKVSGLAAFFSGLLNFGTQRTLGFASLAVVLAFGAIFAVVKMRTTPVQVNNVEQVATGSKLPQNIENIAVAPPATDVVQQAEVTSPVKNKPSTNYTPRPINVVAKSTTPKPGPAPVKLLPGERSYLQTIARLDTAIKSNKKDMRPALQVEYERNLAVVDRAIAATRSAAKSNPKDPDAADFMFAAYQSKVDLLNTIADARVGSGRGH